MIPRKTAYLWGKALEAEPPREAARNRSLEEAAERATKKHPGRTAQRKAEYAAEKARNPSLGRERERLAPTDRPTAAQLRAFDENVRDGMTHEAALRAAGIAVADDDWDADMKPVDTPRPQAPAPAVPSTGLTVEEMVAVSVPIGLRDVDDIVAQNHPRNRGEPQSWVSSTSNPLGAEMMTRYSADEELTRVPESVTYIESYTYRGPDEPVKRRRW
jgi:hypothetical protein